MDKPLPLKQWQCPFCYLEMDNQRDYEKHLWMGHALQVAGVKERK